MHHTLHAPSGTTVTFSWTAAGYDAVAFLHDGTRASLIDDVVNPRSLWLALRWLVETSGLGTVDDLGDALVTLFDGHADDANCEIMTVIEQLRTMRK